MEIKEAKETAWSVQQKLETRHGRQDAFRLVTELAEEVGEIAEAVKAEEGVAGKEKLKGRIGGELADALFSLLVLSKKYETDLDKDFGKVIDGINARYL